MNTRDLINPWVFYPNYNETLPDDNGDFESLISNAPEKKKEIEKIGNALLFCFFNRLSVTLKAIITNYKMSLLYSDYLDTGMLSVIEGDVEAVRDYLQNIPKTGEGGKVQDFDAIIASKLIICIFCSENQEMLDCLLESPLAEYLLFTNKFSHKLETCDHAMKMNLFTFILLHSKSNMAIDFLKSEIAKNDDKRLDLEGMFVAMVYCQDFRFLSEIRHLVDFKKDVRYCFKAQLERPYTLFQFAKNAPEEIYEPLFEDLLTPEIVADTTHHLNIKEEWIQEHN